MVRWVLQRFWTPVGAGVKSDEEVDALALYLFGDSPEGREGSREIDRTIAEIPGLEGLTLLEDYLDAALARAAARPGWGGVAPQPAKAVVSLNGEVSSRWPKREQPAPLHH
jgi:hypothetical protein